MLRTYRAVRDVIADIQHMATAVDDHVGRFQIFGRRENLAHAIAEAERLGDKLQELELQLRRCAHNAAGGKAEVHGLTTELSQAGLP
jgi:hypothetical protein